MKTILIVDDNQFMRALIARALSSLPVRLAEAGDGNQAAHLFDTLQPGLVVTNIVMPGRDGFSLLRHIKERNPAAQVIICSALASRMFRQEALASGAADYVQKPFCGSELRSVIKKVLRSAQPERCIM